MAWGDLDDPEFINMVMTYVEDLFKGRVPLPLGIAELDAELQVVIEQACLFRQQWGYAAQSLDTEVVWQLSRRGYLVFHVIRSEKQRQIGMVH